MDTPLGDGLIHGEILHFRGPEDDILIGLLHWRYEFIRRSVEEVKTSFAGVGEVRTDETRCPWNTLSRSGGRWGKKEKRAPLDNWIVEAPGSMPASVPL